MHRINLFYRIDLSLPCGVKVKRDVFPLQLKSYYLTQWLSTIFFDVPLKQITKIIFNLTIIYNYIVNIITETGLYFMASSLKPKVENPCSNDKLQKSFVFSTSSTTLGNQIN